MKRRLISLIMATTMGAAMIGGGAVAKADSEEKETVKMVVWSSGAAGNFQRGADEFNSRQDKINFVIEMQTGDYSQYLGAKVASGDLPDMFFLSPYSQVQQFAETGRIMDLSDEDFTTRIYDAAKDACSYDGKVYAYPKSLEILGIYYNQELFEKVGITEVPKTMSQLKDACAKLQENGITPFAATFKDAWTLNHLFSCLQGTAVGDYEQWIADMNAGEGSFRNDNSELVFEFFDMMKENSGQNYMDADSTSGYNAFASGEAAMIATGQFSLLNAASINPDLQVGVFGVPLTENEEDAKLDVDVGNCIAVSANTEHLDAVREVLAYLSDNTDENGWMHYTADEMGSAPPAMDFTMTKDYGYIEDYHNYVADNQTKPWVYLQLASGASDIIGPAIQGYFAGTTDMDETLDQMDAQYAELLE